MPTPACGPLISTGDPRKSVDISRKAELYETSSGLLTITGGKLTTWRRMAKQVVDRMVERAGRVAPCRTADIPLGMAAGEGELDPPDGLAEADLPEGYRELLAFRYGHAGRRVLQIAARDTALARADRRRASRTCSPRPCSPPGSSRRARSPTSCCDGPGSACWRRRSLRTAESVRPVAEALGAELGWDDGARRGGGGGLAAGGRRSRLDPAAA